MWHNLNHGADVQSSNLYERFPRHGYSSDSNRNRDQVSSLIFGISPSIVPAISIRIEFWKLLQSYLMKSKHEQAFIDSSKTLSSPNFLKPLSHDRVDIILIKNLCALWSTTRLETIENFLVLLYLSIKL